MWNNCWLYSSSDMFIIIKYIKWNTSFHDDIIKWKYFLHYWPLVRGIHRWLVNSPHNDQWCRALMFSFICTWINRWVNNHEAGDLRCSLSHHCNVPSTTHRVAVIPPPGRWTWRCPPPVPPDCVAVVRTSGRHPLHPPPPHHSSHPSPPTSDWSPRQPA